jgi:hypothetical protein
MKTGIFYKSSSSHSIISFIYRPVTLLFLLLLIACTKESEKDTVVIHELPPFDTIWIKSVFHVFLIQDTVFSIRIEGREDFIDGIICRVENKKLILNNDTKGMWLSPENNKIKLYISSDSLKNITVDETSFVETINPIITERFGISLGNKLGMANLELNCDNFYFWNNHPSGGMLTLRGYTRTMGLWNFAIMSIDASGLITEEAYVENYSKGDCKIRVREKLWYGIYGTGNIYLYGETNQIFPLENSITGKLIHVK